MEKRVVADCAPSGLAYCSSDATAYWAFCLFGIKCLLHLFDVMGSSESIHSNFGEIHGAQTMTARSQRLSENYRANSSSSYLRKNYRSKPFLKELGESFELYSSSLASCSRGCLLALVPFPPLLPFPSLFSFDHILLPNLLSLFLASSFPLHWFHLRWTLSYWRITSAPWTGPCSAFTWQSQMERRASRCFFGA